MNGKIFSGIGAGNYNAAQSYHAEQLQNFQSVKQPDEKVGVAFALEQILYRISNLVERLEEINGKLETPTAAHQRGEAIAPKIAAPQLPGLVGVPQAINYMLDEALLKTSLIDAKLFRS